MSILYHMGKFGIRHAGELCKTHVLSFAAFGALYALGLHMLVSLAVAACYAVALVLSFTLFGKKALCTAGSIGTGGLVVIDFIARVAGDGGACPPGSSLLAMVFVAIGFTALIIPTRQISVLELAGLSKPPASEQ